MGKFYGFSGLSDSRSEKWQACNDDTKQRFQYCENANPCKTISEIIESPSGRQDETDNCDNAYAVHRELSFTEKGVDWDAYMKPRAKITVSSIFLRVAI